MQVSTTGVLAAAAGSESSVATDPIPPLLVPQQSSSFLDSGGNNDGEEEVLVGSVDQITPVSSKRSTKESRDEGNFECPEGPPRRDQENPRPDWWYLGSGCQ